MELMRRTSTDCPICGRRIATAPGSQATLSSQYEVYYCNACKILITTDNPNKEKRRRR